MEHKPSSLPRSRRKRRGILLAAAGAGVAALLIWFDGIFTAAAEFIGVISLFVLAGIIYLFDILVFKSATPRDENKDQRFRSSK